MSPLIPAPMSPLPAPMPYCPRMPESARSLATFPVTFIDMPWSGRSDRGDPYMAQAPIPPIDPAEALIVTVGLEPFLRHTSRDLESAIVRSESLPTTLEAKVYRFINREERETPADLEPVDFDATVALLDAPATDQLEKTIAAFGQRGDLALQVGQQVTRMHAYVQQQIPRRVHSTLAG